VYHVPLKNEFSYLLTLFAPASNNWGINSMCRTPDTYSGSWITFFTHQASRQNTINSGEYPPITMALPFLLKETSITWWAHPLPLCHFLFHDLQILLQILSCIHIPNIRIDLAHFRSWNIYKLKKNYHHFFHNV